MYSTLDLQPPFQVSHRFTPEGDNRAAFGTLKLDDAPLSANVFFNTPEQIDAVIAELAALRAEMTGEACPSVAPSTGRRCTEAGEHVKHRNGMVVWGPGVDEPAPAEAECADYDPAYKLHGCELDDGHDGPHRNLLGVEWNESLSLPCDSINDDGSACTLHNGHFPARHRDADGDEWTDEIYDRSGPRKPEPEAAVNPPHHATLAGEKACTAPGWDDEDSGYVCTAQDGHDGDHVAYKVNGGEYHRWPVTAAVAAPEPLVVSESTLAQARLVAEDIEAGTWPPAVAS